MKSVFVSILLTCFLRTMFSQSGAKDQVLISNQISRVETTAQKWVFTNSQEVNNEQGHLQGVQLKRIKKLDYFYLSGSSSEYSYLAIGRLNDSPSIIQIKKLFSKPLKHAGGFQISENYLAVGIEDNEARNHSQVCVYKLSRKGELSRNPIACIDRRGAYERATAGCVGLTFFDNRWLIVVGDWNTRNLDFYVSMGKNIAGGFRLMDSIRISDCDRSVWSDTTWLAYQNIQLITQEGKIYLIGLNSQSIIKKNIADLFRIDSENLDHFIINKVNHQTLENQGGDFVWGAGGVIDRDQLLGILSCERNLSEINRLYFYPILPE
ncbi:MAG: hypothetical protein IPL46_06575 [Saprospiraceae bacterium]|nr:hypothetical protein [Saprospiraceae bacterium]